MHRANPLAGNTQEWVEVLDKDSNVWDQNAFNDLMRRGSTPLPDDAHRLFQCYDGKLKCGILPVSIFCSGHTGFTQVRARASSGSARSGCSRLSLELMLRPPPPPIQRMPDKLGLKPYVVHATFQFSGTPGKRHRMRERLWWNVSARWWHAMASLGTLRLAPALLSQPFFALQDPPEYFDHEHGFISYDARIPKRLLDAVRELKPNGTLEATMVHFDLVNFQLRQARWRARSCRRRRARPRGGCGSRWLPPCRTRSLRRRRRRSRRRSRCP